MKDFLRDAAHDFVSKVILLALIIPSYFIIVWIFPELEYHGSDRHTPLLIALIYAIGLFAAVAVAAVALFIAAAILIGAVKVLFRRNDA